MKHNKKVNPLTHFNNLKAAAVKKAGKDMSTYKKSLTKAQAGYMVRIDLSLEITDFARTTTPKQDMNNPVQKKGGSVKRKRK